MQDQDIIRLATIAKLDSTLSPTVPESVPVWMAQAKRWILYDRNKKPMSPWDGKLIGGGQKATDGHRWLHFHQAKELAAKHGMGLSIVLGEGVGGIDLDHVRNPETGNMTSFAKEIVSVAQKLGAYCELSPTGTGFKIYGWLGQAFYGDAKCTIPEPTNEEIIRDGKRIGVAAGYDCWVRDRHFCVTGKAMFTPLQELVDITPIQRMIEERHPPEPIAPLPPMPPAEEIFFDARNLPRETGDSIAEFFNRHDPVNCGTWLLQQMGWTFHHQEQGKLHWTRPGKDPAKGLSATLFLDLGTFTVYSSAAPLPQRTYSLFQLYTRLFFNGDGAAAGRAARQWKNHGAQGAPPAGPTIEHRPAPAQQAPQIHKQNPEPASATPGFAYTNADVLQKRYGEHKWIWKDWISPQVLHLITGEPGAGKSLLINDILLRIATGKGFPGQDKLGEMDEDLKRIIQSRRALYIDSDQRMHQYGPNLARGASLDSSIIDIIEFGTASTLRPIVTFSEQALLFQAISQILNEKKHWCLVIDTIARFAGAAELNSPKDLNLFIEPLQRLARDHNIPVFIIGHSSASGDAYGRHIRGACQISWLLSKKEQKLKIDRAFADEPDPLFFDWPETQWEPFRWSSTSFVKKGKKDATDECVETICNEIPGKVPELKLGEKRKAWLLQVLNDPGWPIEKDQIIDLAFSSKDEPDSLFATCTKRDSCRTAIERAVEDLVLENKAMIVFNEKKKEEYRPKV